MCETCAFYIEESQTELKMSRLHVLPSRMQAGNGFASEQIQIRLDADNDDAV